MITKPAYLLIITIMISMCFTAFNTLESQNEIVLISDQSQYKAGESIILEFTGSGDPRPYLICSNSYGSTLIQPTFNNNILRYMIPETISVKSGLATWSLVFDHKEYSNGKFEILPNAQVKELETYIGPPSIEAGGKDYTMLVVIPVDVLDNPVGDSTAVLLKHQFRSSETSLLIYTRNLIAHQNIYSQTKTGRFLISSESQEIQSKEFDVQVLSAIPTNFIISADRHHHYADGNQTTEFRTSVIKDIHGNIVSDGTYVEFLIKNQEHISLNTSGTTVNGIARAYMLHPDREEHWQVTAFILGMAQSNSIDLIYKQAIKDYQVEFSENHRNIKLGPFQSFMGQRIPDGLSVSLSIQNQSSREETLLRTSNNGFTNFYLDYNVFPNGDYTLVIEAAGINKTFQIQLR